MQWKCSRVAILVAMLCLLVAGCEKAPGDFFQGYVEGEFVYVSSPLAGTVQKLFVSRGDQVQAGQPLFALDETMEKAAREQAQAAFTMAEADFKREEQLFRQGPAAAQEYDRARSTRDQDREQLAQTQWNLQTGCWRSERLSGWDCNRCCRGDREPGRTGI